VTAVQLPVAQFAVNAIKVGLDARIASVLGGTWSPDLHSDRTVICAGHVSLRGWQ